MLLGFKTARALLPLRSIAGKCPDDPFAVQTPFRWSIVGQVNKKKHKQNALRTNSIFKNEFPPCAIIRALEQDFKGTENATHNALSQDDNQFLDIIQEGIKQQENGFYTMSLPFKRKPNMPNTRMMAEERLHLLQQIFSKDPEFKQEYKVFMNGI